MNIRHRLQTVITASRLAFLAGCLTTLSFAPFSLFPLAIIGVALLESVLDKVTPRQAALRGWLFGLGLFGTGVYWLFISLHVHGHIPALIAVLLTGAFISFIALFPALSCYCLNRYFPYGENTRLFMAFPALWTLFEWIRSILLGGFPWLSLGYSQTLSPLRGYAPILSVLGVSLGVLFSSGLLLKLVRDLPRRQYKGIWLALMSLALLWGVGSVLTSIPWTKPKGDPVRVSLVQGNVPEQDKWSSNMLQPTLRLYSKLSEPLWSQNDFVIWPESAIPDFFDNQQDFLNHMDALAKKHHTTFITGVPILHPDHDHSFNGVIALGNGSGYYLKHHLVPFGEYIPFQDRFPDVMNFLHIPVTSFVPATKPAKPLLAGPLKILTFICYESAFPEQVRFMDPSINLLLTVSNDGWFGRSTAQAQHLEIAAMRALETGRPMLFAANDGPTAIINAKGQIEALAPAHVPWVLTDRVQPMQGKTPWLYAGMDPLLGLLMVLLFKAWAYNRKMALSPLP